MATEIIAGQLGEIRAASTASGGTALTSTAGYIQLPLKTYHVAITPRNFSTAVVAKIALNPWLTIFKTTDNMAKPPYDVSNIAQDGDASTTIDVGLLDTLANGDFLLIGSHIQFRGCRVDMTSTVNATASTLTVDYWNGSEFTTASATDGTSSSSKTFAQDGLVYWTVPAAWTPTTLKNIYPNVADFDGRNDSLYWTRWSVSVITDSATIESILAANRSTAYWELLSGQCFEERIKHGKGGIGCVEALTNDGTANLIVNVATLRDGVYQ